jgi:hypothetical protein
MAEGENKVLITSVVNDIATAVEQASN